MKRIGILLAMFSLAAVTGCQQEVAEKPAETVVIDSVLSTDSVMIHYTAYGEGDRALVFVHGWSCDQTHWVRQVDTFKDEYRVVTLDLAGHGKSSANRPEWTMESWGDDIAAVVNDLKLKEVALVGHSMGGPVCIEAARRLPEQTVVLIGVDTYQSLGKMPPQEMLADFLAPFRVDFKAATSDFVRMMFLPTADSALVEQLVTDLSDTDPKQAILWFESNFAYNAAAALKDMRKPIRAINCQIWATDVEGNRGVAESFDVVYMPDVGHFPHLENAGAFNGHLRSVLTEFWPVAVQSTP